MSKVKAPLPLFDSLENIKICQPPKYLSSAQRKDFIMVISFLKNYVGSVGTFNSYRREIERLLQWCIHTTNISFKQMKREDIEKFIRFCQKPPKSVIPHIIIKNKLFFAIQPL